MGPRSIQNNEKLAQKIRTRRNELGLTIEEAAYRANVGTKTWSRYEAGEAIRQDKCKGICKALNWSTLPEDTEEDWPSVKEYKNHESWSPFLETTFGEGAALAFAVGSDILLEHIDEDLKELATLPVNSHIGQLSVSFLRDDLPAQFLTLYNYDFLYRLRCCLLRIRKRAGNGADITAHSVQEELLLYLSNEEAKAVFELGAEESGFEETEDWPFELADDMDVVNFLYSDLYLEPDDPYHFSHWTEPQFYLDRKV